MSFWRSSLVQALLMLSVIVVSAVFIASQLGSSNSCGRENSREDDRDKYRKKTVSGEKGTFEVLVIPVHGVIMRGDDAGLNMGENADSNRLTAMIEQAMRDPKIKAVVLDINSPGGEVVATDIIYSSIKKLQKKKNIPVVASLSVTAASGGYYIASAADRIIAHPLCTTGSIGVIISTFKIHELGKKLGISGESYTTGKYKDILSMNRPTSPEEKELIQSHLAKVYERFVSVVAAGRKMDIETVKAAPVGDGRIMLGSEAVKLGLADAEGGMDEALAAAREMASLHEDCRVVVYEDKDAAFGALLREFFSVRSGNGAIRLELPFAGLSPLAASVPGGRYYYLAR